jgi:hypothetical protein
MIKPVFPLLAALGVLLTSCATAPPPPPQVYHSGDKPALVIHSLDETTSRIILPEASAQKPNDDTLNQTRKLPKQAAAVVILENYHESRPGDEFRNRGTSWFVNLRNQGYQQIIFLAGTGAANPDGLILVAKYN